MSGTPAGWRGLCVMVDIVGWSTRKIPGQIRAQLDLADILDQASTKAALDRTLWARQDQGDGELALLPANLDDSVVIADLVREIVIALRQTNQHLSESARIRLRLSFASGLILPGATGFAGNAVIEAARLLNSAPAREAVELYPSADLVLIVSNYLYHDVIAHDFRDLRSDDFWQAEFHHRDRRFEPWLWVSDRSGGPGSPPPKQVEEPPHIVVVPPDQVETVLSRPDSSRDERAAALIQRAERRMGFRDFAAARRDLEEIVELLPRIVHPPGPQAMLLLGKCHAELGNSSAAREVWLNLLSWIPRMPEALLHLGMLAFVENRTVEARDHLTNGLNLVGDGSGAESALFLKALSSVETSAGNLDAARDRLRQAAEADPADIEALTALALDAARRGENGAMGRIVGEIFGRVPQAERERAAGEVVHEATHAPGGDLLLGHLLDQRLIGVAAYSRAMEARRSSP
ncbi:tetratricopeptide repeat protein [Rhizohabitans arisaemae]|uniref:tetratricopeptide repeat protein n=1 Tax=Rhizohabitans arisaemae TaxID=2720610 RepID=UPI0024B09724|nr:hypothetical protein [Rhizohabitans arisaemae]